MHIENMYIQLFLQIQICTLKIYTDLKFYMYSKQKAGVEIRLFCLTGHIWC